MEIINPQKLRQGDVVSIVSPSAGLAPFAMNRIENAVSALERMGLKAKFEENSLKNNGYVSATIEERVSDIHAAFKDKKVKAIFCTIGGNHSNQLLRYLDFDLIRDNPKIFIGYSDITVLLHAIFKKSRLRTFYGPCIMPEFGEYPDIFEYTKKSFSHIIMDGLTGEVKASTEWTDQFLDWSDKNNATKKRINKINDGYHWWRTGEAVGEVFGGAIPSINHLAGTEYWVGYKDKILFIDLPEGSMLGEGISVANVDSYLADLFNLGVFSEIKGLIIGRPYAQSEDNLRKIKDIIIRYTKDEAYPILYYADIGHTSPMMTLPLGVSVTIDSKQNLFFINEPSVI